MDIALAQQGYNKVLEMIVILKGASREIFGASCSKEINPAQKDALKKALANVDKAVKILEEV